MKNNIIEDNKIVAIFSKNKKSKVYKEVTYLSKDIDIQEIFKNNGLKDIVDIENMYSENLSYNKKIIEFSRNRL